MATTEEQARRARRTHAERVRWMRGLWLSLGAISFVSTFSTLRSR